MAYSNAVMDLVNPKAHYTKATINKSILIMILRIMILVNSSATLYTRG